MDLVLLEHTDKRMKFEIKGEEHSFCNALRKELWNSKDIDISGYHLVHPQVSEPVFVVQTKRGDPQDAVLSAVERLQKASADLKKAFQGI